MPSFNKNSHDFMPEFFQKCCTHGRIYTTRESNKNSFFSCSHNLFLGILFDRQSISACLRSELLGPSACERPLKKCACDEISLQTHEFFVKLIGRSCIR